MGYDYQIYKMYKHGCKFLDCALMCKDVRELRDHFNAKVPQIVNMAFACEVFLKTLILMRGKKQTGHELKDLWNVLDNETRQEIVNVLIKETDFTEELIRDGVEDISNAFIEWRYSYEVQAISIHIGFLETFSTVLRDFISSKLYKGKKERYMNFTEMKNLFNEAKAFYELAECGHEHISEKDYVESYIPYIVNMSFCTELYLKLLLANNGKSIDELKKLSHNLYKLYDALEQEQKDEIHRLFKRPLIYQIAKEIENMSLAFQEWRYLVLDKVANYNNKQLRVKPGFMKELNEVLEKMCKDILSEWWDE